MVDKWVKKSSIGECELFHAEIELRISLDMSKTKGLSVENSLEILQKSVSDTLKSIQGAIKEMEATK